MLYLFTPQPSQMLNAIETITRERARHAEASTALGNVQGHPQRHAETQQINIAEY